MIQPNNFLRLARRYSWLSTLPIIALLLWLGLRGKETQEEMRVASQRAVRVSELRGSITYLSEWLALLAQIGATTGESSWTERYEEAAPTLDAAISEASELATPEGRAALASTMGEAHRDVAIMERRALSLAATGDIVSARSLLNGPDYAYLQDVYANGANVLNEELTGLAEKHAAELAARTWLETAGFGLCAILLSARALSARSRKRLQGALARTDAAARTDALTELPNRRQFYEDVDAALREGHRSGTVHALFLIDLDRFKAVNDAHGHPAGDELLRLVAARLRTVRGNCQSPARLGGDEFAVVVQCGLADYDQAMSDAGAVAQRIVAVLSEPFKLAMGPTVKIGASVGIGLSCAGDTTIEELMYRADVALYRAKANGRSCFRTFELGMDAHVRARALLEEEFRQAIAEERIVPHFQPLVDLATRRLVGFEMLARWPHPTRGMVSPVEFIPIAEDIGLIGVMTEQLLRRACLAAADWPRHLSLACNVSPIQLRDPNLPEMVRAVLSDANFPASRVEIEVTESALVGDLDLARRLLNELKASGVRLALDDFGTGYSSLRHLQTLPFDKIKIDRSFVAALVDDPESGKIVSAVLGLGRSLGLITVAEGVETEHTAALLCDLGCEVGQGWFVRTSGFGSAY